MNVVYASGNSVIALYPRERSLEIGIWNVFRNLECGLHEEYDHLILRPKYFHGERISWFKVLFCEDTLALCQNEKKTSLIYDIYYLDTIQYFHNEMHNPLYSMKFSELVFSCQRFVFKRLI